MAPARTPPSATTLLANLIERGLAVADGALVVLDGANAVRKAVRDVLSDVPVHRAKAWPRR